MMNKMVIVLGAAFFFVGQGCQFSQYDVVMSPEDGTLSRKATSQDVTPRGSSWYGRSGAGSPNKGAICTLSEGKYSGMLPNDLGGGFGNYTPIESSAGKLCLYFERFGGGVDAGKQLHDAFKQVDLLADVMLECCQVKYSSHAEYEKLRTFFDVDLRDDAKTLLVYLMMSLAATDMTRDGKGLEYEFDHAVARGLFFLFEKGYFTADDIAIIGDSDNDRQIVRCIIDRKLKIVDPELREELLDYWDGLMGRDAAARAELAGLVGKSATFKKNFGVNPISESTSQPAEFPELKTLVSLDSVFYLFNADIMNFSLDLKSDDQPIATNGHFENGVVKWGRMNGNGILPVFFYAVWTIPDEEFQKKHFGRVFLRGGDLAEYCIWEKSLSESQRKEWREFLITLTPETLEEKLPAFRFKTQPAAVPWPTTQPESQPTSQPASQPTDEPVEGVKIMGRGYQATTQRAAESQPVTQPAERK